MNLNILLNISLLFLTSSATTDSDGKTLGNITNLGEISIKELTTYPPEQWSTVTDKVLATMTPEQSAVILDRIKFDGNLATWSRMLNILGCKLTPSEVIQMIKSTVNLKGTYGKEIAQSLGDCLEEPKTWNATVLNQLGPSIANFFPFDVMQNWPIEAQTMYFQLMEHRCKSVDQRLVIYKLIEDVYGPTSSWKQINESIAKWLPRLSPSQLNGLDVTTVKTNLRTICSVNFKDRDHAQPIIAKAIESLQSETNLSKAKDLFQTMSSNLVAFVRLSDVQHFEQGWFQDDAVQQMLISSNNKDESFRRHVLTLSKPEDGHWTESNVSRLKYFLHCANNQILLELRSKGLLGREAVETIFNDPRLDGGQVHILKEIVEKFYKHGDQWDITSMPARLLPIVSNEAMAILRPEDVVNQMDKLNSIAHLLDAEQMTVLTDKLIELGLDRVSKVEIRPNSDFMRMISTKQMSTLDNKTTSQLIKHMEIESPHVRHYIGETYAQKKVTLEDIRNDPILANSMNCRLLNGFPDSHIMEVLMTLHTTATEYLKPKLSKCLADKLKLHLRSMTKDDRTDDETDLLFRLKPTELGIVGGDILIHFSADALQGQTPQTKCRQIFFLIGQLPLSTINMLQPYEKKRQLARAAVNCLEKREGTLELADMSVIGNLVGYVSETSISKMSDEAFTLNMQLLSGHESRMTSANQQTANRENDCGWPPAEPPVVPCLRPAMRQALRHKLTTVFGQPDSWNETQVRSIGCLLNTLYPEQLRQIKNEVLVSVADRLDRCWRTNSVRNAWDRFGIFRILCKNELLGAVMNIEEAEKQLRRRLKEAIIEHAASHRTKEDSQERLNCHVIRTAPNSVITEASVDELNSLARKDILDCLENLGEFPIAQEKATILWNKVKQAYGKTAHSIDPSVYHVMGFVTQGLNLAEIATLHLNNTSIINAFGRYNNLTSEQIHALAVQVKADYQSDAERFRRKDLLTFAYIVCGFQASDIEKISTNVFMEIGFRMSDELSTCNVEIKKSLARKAVHGFGDPGNWTMTTVSSIGYVLGGLTLEQLASIPGESFEGLLPKFVVGIPPEKIKGLKPYQLDNLSIEAINHLAQDQLNQLDSEQLQVVNKLKNLYNRGSSLGLVEWILPMFTVFLLV